MVFQDPSFSSHTVILNICRATGGWFRISLQEQQIINAFDRVKQLKNWRKDWKWDLIKEENQNLEDLAADWFTEKEIYEFRDECTE